MAINVSFNGATIYKPGAYSKTNIDLGGGFPLGPAGLVAVLGEADAGAPGSAEVNIAENRFGADQLVSIRNKYRTGNIVDAAGFLFSPAADGAIPSGAQTVWFYKTNASVRASLTLAASYGTVRAREWGIGGNRITYKSVLVSETAPQRTSSALAFPGLPEITTVQCQAGSGLASGGAGLYWTIAKANDASAADRYYVWYQTGTETDPAVAGKTGVVVSVLVGDTASQVATKTRTALLAISGTPFSIPVPGADTLTITTTASGPALDAAADTSTFIVNITQQGDSASGAYLNGKSFSVRKNGEASATVVTLSNTESDHDSAADLAAEIQTALGGSYVVSAPSATTIRIALAAAPSQYQLGWGRSIELIDSTPGDLAILGLSEGLSVSALEPSATITLDQKRDQLVESSTVGGNVVLAIGRDSSGGVSDASIDVDEDNITLSENASPVHILPKSSFSTLKDLADEISLRSGWSASVPNSIYNQLNPSSLDEVVGVDAFSEIGAEPARIKKDAQEVQDMFELSSIASLEDAAQVGLPNASAEMLLAGGAKGATTSADIVAALEKFEKFHVNAVVPLFSRDATDDIADGLTDSMSTYTIDGIHQAVKTHLSLMKTTKRRSERQGYLSLRDTYSNCKAQAGVLADGRIQLTIQDVRQVDSQGTIKWFQPWALASMLAGARGGAPIGEPLTFKNMNVSGIRQTAQSMSTPEQDIVIDFDPDLQTDDAIQAGITFLEAPQTGGFRVVVDNTTYGRDANFVYNRANVLYAADIVAFNFRNSMEQVFVGKKNTVSVADVAGVATQVLGTFLAQGITVATPDAPQGFKSLVVRIEGSVIYIEVTIKIVEGIDFVLSDITIQRAISG